MTLMRKQVRDYVQGRLMNATAAGDQVTQWGMTNEEGPWPLIGIYTPEEVVTDEVTDSGDYEVMRTITLEIVQVVKVEDTYAADLDALAEEVQTLIDYDLGALVQSCQWQKDEIDVDSSGETNFAFCKSTYNVIYRWDATPLGDGNPANLNTIHIDEDMYSPNNGTVIGPDGQIDMQVHLTDLNPPS